MKQSLKNRVVIITGATGGVGSEVAADMAKAGAILVLVARDKKKLAAMQKLFGKGQCLVFSVPVENQQKVHMLARAIYNKFGRIDILVNTAGTLGPVGEFHTNSLAEWKKPIAVNLFGTINFCHAVLPFMVRHKSGKIINFSGGGAVQPFPNFSAYAASKAAVVRFSENLAREYEKYNIQINAIAPGIINTKFLTDTIKAGEKKVGKEYFKKVLEQKKSGGDNPGLAAALALFLSQPSNKLTGKLIAAKWDNWKSLDLRQMSRLNKTSLYNLRRIDNKYFREI